MAGSRKTDEDFGIHNGIVMETAMLVLTRRIGETVVFTGGIEVKVLALFPGKVTLGIQAPEEVAINRKERMEVNGYPGEQLERIEG